MRRVPELDGLRGLAILLVVSGHVITGIGPYPRAAFGDSGGLFEVADTVGVQLFFALSGFLITTILLGEVDRSGTITLRSFWWRRLRRLYPPLIALSSVYLVTMILIPWTRGEAWTGRPWAGLGDVAMSLTYTTNLVWLWVPRSGWLSHTWSLAVEEQFYLIWPLVILAVLAVAAATKRRTVLVSVIAAGVVATIAARALLPEAVMERGLRWDALLLGALIAVTGWRTPRLLTWASVAAILAMSVVVADSGQLLYTASAAVSALVVGGAHHLQWFRWPVLVHFGYISYSLYLWHAFVLRFAPPWWISIPVSLVVAEASYRFIERRFMANPPPLRPPAIDLRDSTDGPVPKHVPTEPHRSG